MPTTPSILASLYSPLTAQEQAEYDRRAKSSADNLKIVLTRRELVALVDALNFATDNCRCEGAGLERHEAIILESKIDAVLEQ